jgi:hypothetical protein
MPLIIRSSAAFSWLTGSFGSIGLFSEGTLSARGWRWPTGAAAGGNCWPEFVDGGVARFREPAACAIATEVSTRASNTIVVINFRMTGLAGWGPLTIMVTGSSITRCGKPHVLFRCSSVAQLGVFPLPGCLSPARFRRWRRHDQSDSRPSSRRSWSPYRRVSAPACGQAQSQAECWPALQRRHLTCNQP